MPLKLEKIESNKSYPAVGPYSQAIRVGETIYVSGCIPINPETKKMVEGFGNQVKQTLNNMKVVVEEANSSFDRVAKCTVLLAKGYMKEFATFNKIYAEFFTSKTPPARETFEVSALPCGALIEISCIAIKN